MTEHEATHADHDHDHDHGGHDGHDGHGHSHGLVDRSIVRSREGVKAVSISLAVLGIAAGIQLAIFTLRCYAAQGGTRHCANPVTEPDSLKID